MTALYIHIPFCKRKCNYCDFVSYAGKEGMIQEYVKALTRELQSVKLAGNLPLPEGEGLDAVETIYFGGGTPTLLSSQHFERILFASRTSNLAPREVTVEANPGTVSKAYLKELRQLGINRISLGAQTFNDRHLKTLGRIHDSKQIYRAVEDARSAGFNNINLDLIFSLPNQTLDELKEDIKQALSLQTEHLSTYNLQLEEGTPLGDLLGPHPVVPLPAGEGHLRDKSPLPLGEGNRRGEGIKLPSEDQEAEMYEYIIETLTANGLRHYEISNFAKPGRECRHNINYWKNGNYLGLGAGAHSHVDGKRWSNPNCLEKYIEFWKPETKRLGFQNQEETAKFIRRFPTDLAQRETLFMGLRLLEGLPNDSFAGFEADLADLKTQGLLEEIQGKVKLTKKGLLLANLVFERFV